MSLVILTVLTPVVLALLAEFFNAIILISSLTACVVVFCTGMYEEIFPQLQAQALQESEIFHRFGGDPLKMHYYHGFKKHFDGDLTVAQLQHWLLQHRPRI